MKVESIKVGELEVLKTAYFRTTEDYQTFVVKLGSYVAKPDVQEEAPAMVLFSHNVTAYTA